MKVQNGRAGAPGTGAERGSPAGRPSRGATLPRAQSPLPQDTGTVFPALGRGARGGERRRWPWRACWRVKQAPGSAALRPLRTGTGLGSGVTCLELRTPSCEVLLSSPSALGRVFHHFMMQSVVFWFSCLFKMTVT